MLHEILNIFRSRSLVQGTQEDFRQMLTLNHQLCSLVLETMASGGDWEAIHEEIYELDQKINQYEHDIRLAVLTHLSVPVNPNLPSSLALMRITHDAERIGDYGKNMYQLFRRFPDAKDDPCFASFLEMKPLILNGLLTLRDSYAQGDNTAPVQEFMNEKRIWAKKCSEAMDKLIAGEDSCSRPAACALGFRFFKRLLGHMDHIAGAIVGPLAPVPDEDQGKGSL